MNSQVAYARTVVYSLLAAGFSYPDRQLFAPLADGRFADEMQDALKACGSPEPDAGTMAALRFEHSFEDFEAAYLRAFETNAPEPSVSLYEASYIPGMAKSELLLELKAFYDHFGLGVAPGLHELEDKLTAELEIMQFLAAKQAQATGVHEVADQMNLGDDPQFLRPEPYVLAQRDFLHRHLAVWIPKFNEAVAARTLPSFFGALARTAASFVVHDSEAMELAARRLDVQRSRPFLPVGLEGGFSPC